RHNPIPDKTATLTVSKPAKSRILSAIGFEIDETSEPPRIYCEVPNTTEQIDLSDKITVMPNRTWKLYEDINGDNELTTKTMSLETGHNIAYIIITDLINNTATYEVDVYRLDMKTYTFKNEGQIHASGEIEEKSQLESPAVPEKTYYTFTGWAVEGSTDIVQFPYTVTDDITFVAQYTPVNFVITYYLDGGQNDEGNPEYYSIETPDIELMPATREYYDFGGWFEDGQFGTEVNVIKCGSHGDKNLYAKWTPIEYKINYYPNGGENDGRNPEYYNVETPDIELMPATREYYDFGGWFEDEQFGTQVTVIERGSYGEKSLYAKWTLTEYAINYHLNGGINDEGNPEYYNIETPDIELLPATRDGYVFEGWYSDAQFGTEVTVIEHGSSGEKELYAKWGYGSEGLIYEQIGNEYKVIGYNGNAAEIIVPEEWKGLPVTAIGKGVFANCTNLKEITIPFVGATKDGDTDTHFGYIFGAEKYDKNTDFVPTSLKSVIITGGSTIDYGAFMYCASLESISIPESVTKVGNFAFEYCTNLTSVEFGENSQLASISCGMFEKCSSLKSIKVPDSVTYINDNAFEYCTNLESVTFGENSQLNYIGELVFDACTNLKSIKIPDGVLYLGGYAFGLCTSLESVIFGEKSQLKYIDCWAFSGCSSLKSIQIPDSVTLIDMYAFDGCTSLVEITLPFVGEGADGPATHFGYIFGAPSYTDNAKYVPTSLKTVIIAGGSSIGSYAFYNCASIESIKVPDSVTSIGLGAFEGCTSLKSIILPFVGATKDGKTNTHFGYIFGASSYSENSTYVLSSLKTVILTGGTFINEWAFVNCESLESVEIPDSVTSISDGAFHFCTSLKSIYIPDSTTFIGHSAFQYCTSLESVTIGNSVTSIGNAAFSGCTSLENVKIGNSVSSISTSMFANCTSLTSIIIPDSVTIIGRYAFYNCTNLEKITIPFVGATKDGDTNMHFGYIFGANSYSENATYVPSSLKTLIITVGTAIGERAFYKCANIQSITIPDGVTQIGFSAFEGCTSLEEITLPFVGATNDGTSNTHFSYIFGASSDSGNATYVPSSLKTVIVTGGSTIDIFAFRDCANIESVEIPASVTSIGSNAFDNCVSLKNVTFANNSQLTSIGNNAFNLCISLKNITFANNSQLTSIGSNAFNLCISLTNITIPNSVTSVGRGAFSNCFNLEKITIPFVGAAKDGTSNTHFGYIFGADGYEENTTCVPSSLKSVIITGGTKIGERAFYKCANIQSITIPDSVTFIGACAFADCGSLTAVYITDIASWCKIEFDDSNANPLYFAKNLYLNNKLVTQLEIPDSVTSIGIFAFVHCESFIGITIPDSVTSIGWMAFEGCTSLTGITIPDEVTSIGVEAFYGCTKLKSVTFGEQSKLTSIGRHAFLGCTSLTSIIIPDSVTSIGELAFYECENLTSVIFKRTSGWTADDTSISSSNLENPATAAKYLKDTYCLMYWKRTEAE
ncbi:MAG: leucine-rich repeat protein, partial [Clostridiales bacterium]|nr:leucine-rich repeat protein [Clostridiales bacterium]